MPYKDAHRGYKFWFHSLSSDLRSDRPSLNQLHHPDHGGSRLYSPLPQGLLPNTPRNLLDTELLRIEALATTPPTAIFTYIQERLQVPQEPCNPPAPPHYPDASVPVRHLPQRNSLSPCRVRKVTTTTHILSSQLFGTGCKQGCLD